MKGCSRCKYFSIINYFITMPKITKVFAREILDSRGKPTLETTVWAGGVFASASVPSGASTGSHEALELRDQDKKRYGGLGVLKACANVNKALARVVVGENPFLQEKIDRKMLQLDGTDQKSKLGANAILSVSLAASRLAAKLKKQELYAYLAGLYGYTTPRRVPTPLFNVINGGVHADSGLEIQEFFLIPQKGKFKDKLRMGAEVYYVLKKLLSQANFATSVGDEGGFAPRLGQNEAAFQVLEKAVAETGYKLGRDFALGIDAASSEFFDRATASYVIAKKKLTSDELLSMYKNWCSKYGLAIIEDGMAEDDLAGWKSITKELGKKTVLVGDDFFVTNAARLAMGIKEKAANAILIKVNQIGTLTETLEAVRLAQRSKYKVVVSHRSGETNDDYIADLAVAVGADYAKMGSLSRGERLAKYNRLLWIEENLKSR